jgi:hypothetical protein
MDNISEELRKAARSGFISAFEHLIEDELLEELAKESFDEIVVSNLFLDWKAAGWIDIPDMEAEDPIGTDEFTHAGFLDSARQTTVEAMKSIYKCTSEKNLSTAKDAMNWTLECRKRLHGDILRRLEAPGLTDQTGLGACFATIYSKDYDKVLCLMYLIAGREEFADDIAALDELARRDKEWTASRQH